MSIKSKEYFPPNSNSIYIYRGFNNNLIDFKSSINYFNNNLISFKSSIDYFNNNKIQVRFDNGITNIVNIYEYTDNGIKLSFQLGNTYHHQNFLDEPNNMDDYLIKEPIVKDNMWLLSDGKKRCITNVDIKVKTQFNLFPSAIEIVTISKDNSEFSVDYYVLGIGLIKSIYYIEKIGLSYCELEDIIENSPYSKNVKIYYPDESLNTIWYSNKTLNYNTNEDITLGFSKLFQTPPTGLLPIINRNTKINKISYNYKNNFAHIDFHESIMNTLKENALKAKAFFDCIYNTLKNYYKTEKIYITINNHLFTDYFTPITPTKDTNIIEWRVQNCKYPFTYVIKENDTLINISNKFDISYEKIAKLNNIKNPNKLSKNQVLQLYSSGVYTIKEGDSLESISKMFNLSINKIMELNNISDLNIITAGPKIKLC